MWTCIRPSGLRYIYHDNNACQPFFLVRVFSKNRQALDLAVTNATQWTLGDSRRCKVSNHRWWLSNSLALALDVL